MSCLPGILCLIKLQGLFVESVFYPERSCMKRGKWQKESDENTGGGRVLDLACGHGLLAHIMMILDDSSLNAIAVDRQIPKNAEKLSESLIESWPRLKDRIQFKEKSIEELTILSDDLVVSAHACGSLTDLVIEKAVEKHARLAVLPCCHDLKKSSTDNLEGWMENTLAVDAVRAMQLKLKGYKVITQTIPNDITPKNRLLMGEFYNPVKFIHTHPHVVSGSRRYSSKP